MDLKMKSILSYCKYIRKWKGALLHLPHTLCLSVENCKYFLKNSHLPSTYKWCFEKSSKKNLFFLLQKYKIFAIKIEIPYRCFGILKVNKKETSERPKQRFYHIV
jgi:hypothetical protein